eukprot:363941-Chlamydomonas_euryale.AAC.10
MVFTHQTNSHAMNTVYGGRPAPCHARCVERPDQPDAHRHTSHVTRSVLRHTRHMQRAQKQGTYLCLTRAPRCRGHARLQYQATPRQCQCQAKPVPSRTDAMPSKCQAKLCRAIPLPSQPNAKPSQRQAKLMPSQANPTASQPNIKPTQCQAKQKPSQANAKPSQCQPRAVCRTS